MFNDLDATVEESRRSLPGDRLVPDAGLTIMNAVTIAASPDQVWPWLVQMGSGRGGWYAYDFVDNDGHPSAKVILPTLQHIAVGDILPSLPGTQDSFVVAAVEPEVDLILTVPSGNGGNGVSWEFFLEPLGDDRTRLLVRGRVSPNWPAGSGSGVRPSGSRRPIEHVYSLLAKIPRSFMIPIAVFGHGLMQARQLRDIKQRAEKTQPALLQTHKRVAS